jgi:hypothetical protein
MIELDPALVLKSPWLWDEETIAWAQAIVEAALASATAQGKDV